MKLPEVVSLYISHKRALGYRYRSEADIFKAFCKAIGNKSIHSIKTEIIMDFIKVNGVITPYGVKKYHVLCGFYRYSLSRGLTTVSPMPETIPKPSAPPFVPYIYSHEEIKRLLDVIPATCTNRVHIDAEVLRILILLLYSTGMRLGEPKKRS